MQFPNLPQIRRAFLVEFFKLRRRVTPLPVAGSDAGGAEMGVLRVLM